MTYVSIDELPDHVRAGLPEDAQDCYLRAHNAVCARARRDDEHASEIELAREAERTAWEAVKRVYEPDEHGHWRRRVQIEQPWSQGEHPIDRR